MKIDLHVHTRHSRRPAVWLLQKLGCPESFTDPVECYKALKRLGMSHVTFTDHNCIGACMDIAHLPDTFISEEITAYFPEDRCKVHVLAYDITQEIHKDIQELRENLYDLVAYLRENNIFHAIAHPFSAVNDRFTPEHFEKLLLLFRVFEINGDQEREVNDLLRHILETLEEDEIARLVDKHGIAPCGDTPWRKVFISGSDDHAGIGFGRSYTRAGAADSTADFFQAIYNGNSSINAHCATGRSFARDIYAVAYHYVKDRFNLHRFCGSDLMLRFADAVLEPGRQKKYGFMSNLGLAFGRRWQNREADKNDSLTTQIRSEASRLIQDSEDLMRMALENDSSQADDGRVWFEFVNKISSRTLGHLAQNFIDRLSGGQLFDLFHILGSAGSLYLMLAPYFVSYPFFAAERRLARRIADRLRPNKRLRQVRLGHFTDTFREVNGVAMTIKRNLSCARETGKNMTVITSYTEDQDQPGVKNFTPVCSYSLPEYPEMKLSFPPFLELLDYCFDKDFTYIHAATPGPVGMCGLAVARILGIPVCSTYHTAIADYADKLTGDKSLADMVWRYSTWFYNQMDMVLVSSKHSYNELVERGVIESKIKIFPRGVNCELFTPANKDDFFEREVGVKIGQVLLYVGRVSKEKGLDMLPEVYSAIEQDYPDVTLVVCGDGPYREEMEKKMYGQRVIFTGYLDQPTVARAYAGAGLFVFPSATDTFGNVVLESQASGTPVVVSDVGGPMEIMDDGVTGSVFSADNPQSLLECIRQMLDKSPDEQRVIRNKCRSYALERSYSKAFDETWGLYSAEDGCTQDKGKSAPGGIGGIIAGSGMASMFSKSVHKEEAALA